LKPETASGWLTLLRKRYPSRSLVPFARNDHTDDFACFDGTDMSGDPKVFYVNAEPSPGADNIGEVVNFDAWLKDAIDDAQEHTVLQRGDER
jgi:hypothetical protein